MGDITKKFFEENPLSEMSAALLTHFRMVTITFSDLDEKINEIVLPTMEMSRYEQCMEEKEYIRNLDNGEDIDL